MKSIDSFLPPPRESIALIQFKVPQTLRNKFKLALKKRRLTATDFLIAAMKSLIEDSCNEKTTKQRMEK